MNAPLKSVLTSVANRQRRFQLWARLTVWWAAAAFLGAALILFQLRIGWSSALVLPCLALATFVGAFLLYRKYNRSPSFHLLAAQIEARFLELDGRLLTAVEQEAQSTAELNFLQQRVVSEALAHGQANDWADIVSRRHVQAIAAAHWLAVLLFAVVLYGLRTTGGHHLLARFSEPSISVTPGDAIIERGSSLVVLARFEGKLPGTVELVTGNGNTRRISLAKNLADPIFGGSVPEVSGNFTYHIEYGSSRTREFKVSVFEYPRLERADIDLAFPAYTGLAPKRIEDTRRLTAVEGSKVDLTLQLNKPVATARLVPRASQAPSIPLTVVAERAVAALKQFTLQTNQVYELLLVDAEGRTNRAPSQFFFEAVTNRIPEFHLVAPRGDQRPSPLEEIAFEGTVWDDFGLQAYGLGYTIPGHDTVFIELGHALPGQERKTFQYMMRLEDLGLEPDQLISWFVWGDDIGPDGQGRRSTGDLFFGEVRPFEEVFREGQSPSGESGQQSGSQGNRSAKMAELQKQIINATWRLQREHGKTTLSSPKTSLRLPVTQRPQATVAKASMVRNGQFMAAPARAQITDGPSKETPGIRGETRSPAVVPKTGSYPADAEVVRDAQADALQQAEQAAERTDDPRMSALWASAIKQMELALSRLKTATNSPGQLSDALAAEQAAYQALLKVQQHEYEVVRNRNRNQRSSGGGREQQLQRQLEDMDLTQAENRYETQKQAQPPQEAERREQLQVMNRLQELARRQQDLNEKLKELQSALQEAKTDQQREEIRRELKRLQDEERQMLADVDEMRQRMDRPENQTRMSEQRKQLEDTREEMQKAAQAAEQGATSQALASGTRAQRQLQQMHDQMRKENSSQFAEDLRQMRDEARELARQQDELLNKLNGKENSRSLSDEVDMTSLTNRLASQEQKMTNLVDRAGALSQQAEGPEPLLSKQLYDTLRKFNQENARHVREMSDDLLNRGLMPRRLYEQLKNSSEQDASKLFDIASELLRQDLRRPAAESAQRSRSTMEELKTGIERAAQSVLGDDTAALKLAQQELDQLTAQLQREMAANEQQQKSGRAQDNQKNGSTNGVAEAGKDSSQPQPGEQQRGSQPRDGNRENASESAQASSQGKTGETQNQQGTPTQSGQRQDGANPDSNRQDSQRTESSAADNQRGNRGQAGNRPDSGRNNGGYGGYGGGLGGFDRVLDEQARSRQNPITGDDFVPWSDRLRDVEEMIDVPEWRNDVAQARERARMTRQAFRKDSKKPDWAVVQAQIIKPLVEVRDKVSEELARRGAAESLVPIDRDPVPTRYSDLVRRYYERLGTAK